jgi:hypothetical protein
MISGINSYWITSKDATDSIRSKHNGNTPAEALADFARTFTDLAGATIRIEEAK